MNEDLTRPPTHPVHDVRWNAAMTIAWTALIILVWQGLIALWVSSRAKAAGIVPDTADWMANAVLAGDLMKAVAVGGAMCVLMIVAVIRLKKGSQLSLYLPFKKVAPLEFFKWLGLSLLVVLLVGNVFQYFGFEESKSMDGIMSQMRALPLMYVSVVLVAPIAEELLFRGFVISGLERLKLPDSPSLAVGISAFLWAMLHLQYHAHEMFQIFLLGVVLGFARLKTRSLVTPVVIHVVNNLAALLIVIM